MSFKIGDVAVIDKGMWTGQEVVIKRIVLHILDRPYAIVETSNGRETSKYLSSLRLIQKTNDNLENWV